MNVVVQSRKPLPAVSVSTDVSPEIAATRQAEGTAREKHANLAMAVAMAELGIWELDLETREFTASAQCRAHLGLPPLAPVTYLQFVDQLHSDDRTAVEATLETSIANGSNFSEEFRVRVPDGAETRWLSARAHRIEEGRPRLLGSTLDVSARRNATSEAERLVTERTKRLRDNVTELEAFAYSMSHDLRTPLRSMRSYADVLLQECGPLLSPHGRHYLDRISASALRMDRMIQDILTFSRLAPGQVVNEPVDLNRLTHEIVDNCVASAISASISVEGTLPWVLGNSTALTQCLSNLVDNAVKFVAPGVQPCVRIWAEAVPAHGGFEWVRVNVQDNGIGIPEKEQTTIFEIFQRANSGYEGSGIGLAIVQKAIARMGGRVGVHSETGQGSLFWLDLKPALFSATPVVAAS